MFKQIRLLVLKYTKKLTPIYLFDVFTKGACFHDWDLSHITCCFEKVIVSGLCVHIEVPILPFPQVLVWVVLLTAGAVDVAQQCESGTVSSPAFGHKTV